MNKRVFNLTPSGWVRNKLYGRACYRMGGSSVSPGLHPHNSKERRKLPTTPDREFIALVLPNSSTKQINGSMGKKFTASHIAQSP